MISPPNPPAPRASGRAALRALRRAGRRATQAAWEAAVRVGRHLRAVTRRRPPRTASAPPIVDATPAVAAPRDRRLCTPRERVALDWLLPKDADRRRYDLSEAQARLAGLRDFLILEADAPDRCPTPGGRQPPPADALFDALRWGGQVLILGDSADAVAACRQGFAGRAGWCCEQPDVLPPPRSVGGKGLAHLCTVRKVGLEPPGRLTARHSYEVSLVHRPDRNHPYPGRGSAGWAVEKRVPTHDETLARLIQTHPTLAPDQAKSVVKWLVKTAFPLMLTRETAFLQRLYKRMPAHLSGRTPQLLKMEKDERGLVRRIHMDWLRQGGETLPQVEFARQAAEMLAAAHHDAGLLHLDVRLGNLVVTERGVGLIDFGSSVMVGEDLSANRTVEKVIRRTLESSEVTDNLKRHRRKGLLGNPLLDGLPYPPGPGFDLFALATCMTRPHELPDFRGLIAFRAGSPEAVRVSQLRRRVLRRPAGAPGAVSSLDQLARALDELDAPAARTAS